MVKIKFFMIIYVEFGVLKLQNVNKMLQNANIYGKSGSVEESLSRAITLINLDEFVTKMCPGICYHPITQNLTERYTIFFSVRLDLV